MSGLVSESVDRVASDHAASGKNLSGFTGSFDKGRTTFVQIFNPTLQGRYFSLG